MADDIRIKIALDGVPQVQAGATAAATALGKVGQAGQQVGAQNKLTGQQTAQLSAQLQDFFVQVQAGGSPLTALIQQGSQLSAVFGGGGNALRAVTSLITPAVAGFGLLAAGAAAAAIAYKQGAAEQDAFARGLILTGDASGKTVGSLNATAKAISAIAGSRGKAAEALNSLVAAGGVFGDTMQRAAQAAIRLERVGGPAVEETVKQFSALGKEPLQAATKLNEKTNFLTRSVYEQIKALEQSGNVAQAARVAQLAYADALDSRTAQLEARLGSFERAWRAVGDTAKGAWDKMLNIGRPETVEDAVAKAEAGLVAAQKRLSGGGRRGGTGAELRGGGTAAEVQAAQELLDTQREGLKIDRQIAEAQAGRAARMDAVKDTESLVESSLSNQLKLTKQLDAARTRMELAGRDPKEIQAALTALTQGSAAFQQSIGAAMARIDGELQAAADTSRTQQEQLRKQAELGLLSQFGLERELAQLRLKDNQAQLDAVKAREGQVSRQREPLVELLKLENERNSLIRERKALLDAEARVIADLVRLGERRQVSPTEAFRTSERQADQGIDDGLRQRRVDITASIQEQARAQELANRELTMEAALIGQSASARGVAIQQLRIQLQLEEQIRQIKAVNPPGAGRDDAIAAATARAKQEISSVATKANVDYIADLLDPTRAKTFGEALTDAFEGAGNSLVKLINTLEEFSSARIASEERLKSIRNDPGLDEETRQKGINAEIEKSTKAQVSAYATMAGAAKGFFRENSKGYKTLEAIETGFRLAQIAGVVQTTAAKVLGLETVTAVTLAEETKRQVLLEAFRASELASDAAHVAASIAQSQAVGQASVAPAIAKEGSQSGLYGAIAMAALLAAIGYATGSFGKSAGGSQATAAQRQGGAATGRIVTPDQLDRNSPNYRGGTVFGNDEARSESIAKSIDLLEDHARLELDYSRNQLNALEAIRDSMEGVANLVVRTAGGSITTGKNFNVQTGLLARNEGDPILKMLGINDSGVIQSLAGAGSVLGKIGVFAQGLWGKVTQKIADSGLDVSGTISDVLVRQYADVEKTTSSFFGLKKKTTTETLFGNEKDVQGLADQFGLIFKSIGDSVKASAEVLGREGGDALAQAIATFPVAIERLSLKDLKGDELQEAISAAVGAQADTIAQSLVPGLEAFQTVGQGYFETLVRVSSGIEAAKYQLDLLSISAVDYTDVIRTQGDVGAEIVRQSIAAAETASGVLSNVGAIVNTLSGSAEDLSETYSALLDVRTALIKVGESGESLTTAMIRGAGGLDALSGSLDTFFTEFYSDQERLTANSAALSAEFGKLGFAVPLSREEFRELVHTLNDGTEAGAKMAAKVLGLAGAFDEVADAAEEAASRLTDSIGEAISRFGTPQERQDASFGGIAYNLRRDAGVSVSIGQLIGASIQDIDAFARAFLAVSTNSDAAKAAVLDAANALFDLKTEAAGQRASLEVELLRAQGRELEAVARERKGEIDQLAALEASLGVAAGTFTTLQQQIYAAADAAKLLSGVDNVIGDFLSPKDLAQYRASRIQQTLAAGGINATTEQIIGATTAGIVELWNGVGEAGKQAILDSYGALTQLQTDLTKQQRQGLEDQLAGMKGLRDLAKDIKQFVSTARFGDLSPLSAEAQVKEARGLFDTTLAAARGGDTKAQGNLLSNAQAYLQELQSAFASGPGYTAEFERVTSLLEALGLDGEALDPQIQALESLADNSRAMLDALLSIDTTLKGGGTQGIGDRTFVSGPAGSSGGLSGTVNGDRVITVSASVGTQDASAAAQQQIALLQRQVEQLSAAVTELKAQNVRLDAIANLQQLSSQQVGQKLDGLRVPLEESARQARLGSGRALLPG